MTFAAILAPWLKALIAFFGLGVGVAAAASPSPKQAVLRRQLQRATIGTTILPPRYQLAGPIVVNTSGQVAGSADDLPDAIDPAAPAAALAEIARLDSRWARPVEAFRALHDSVPTQAQKDAGTARIYRYPTRWAVLRATLDALQYGDAFASKWGERWSITDPTTNEVLPEWLEMISIYAPGDDDWAATASNLDAYHNAPPDPGVLDYLSGLVDFAGDALALDWRGALKGAVKLSDMGGDSPTLRTRSAQLSREEWAILNTLRAWSRPVQVEQLSGGVGQVTRTAWEALSGGGTPLDRGLSSLGGRAAVALRLRGIPELTPASKLLSDDSLVLKAVLIARRWPTVNGAGVGEWPYSAVPKSAASASQPASGGPVGPRGGDSQSQGTNNQYTGPQQ